MNFENAQGLGTRMFEKVKRLGTVLVQRATGLGTINLEKAKVLGKRPNEQEPCSKGKRAWTWPKGPNPKAIGLAQAMARPRPKRACVDLAHASPHGPINKQVARVPRLIYT